MSTTPPEPSPAQIDQWWAETLDVHAVNPRPAFMQLARLAYAAGWEARGTVKESLTARAALERLVIMASNELASGQLVYSQPEWDDAIAAARDVLASATSDGPAVPEGREPAAVAKEPSDEELCELAEVFNGDPVPAMRRALQLWGRPVPPPVEGDVAELVEELQGLAEYFSGEMYSSEWIDQLNRAAALLERQAAPVPVAVSERLPGTGAVAGELILVYRRGGDEVPHPLGLAAALEALADQVAPSDANEPRNNLPALIECQRIRSEILAIAAELRGGAA